VTTASEAAAKGYQLRREGNLPLARECYAEAARLYRDQKDVLAYAHSIRHIADIYQEEKNPASARTLYEEALEIYRGNLATRLLDLANTVRPYAILIEGEGDSAAALALWKEARNLYGSLRLQQGVDECSHHILQLQGGRAG
jgi:tetratricopeptide (TPR) repeat protein